MKFFITFVLITLSFCGESFSREKLFYKCDISNLENNPSINNEEDIILFKKFSYISFHTDLVTDGKLSNGHMSNLRTDWYPDGNLWDGKHLIVTLTENLIIFDKANFNAFDYDRKKNDKGHALILRKDDTIFLTNNFTQKKSSSYFEDLSKDESLFLKCLKINKENLPKNIE